MKASAFLLIALAAVSACEPADRHVYRGSDRIGSPEEGAFAPEIERQLLEPPAGYIMVDSAVLDIDDARYVVELHVLAETRQDGAVLWEDGHRWLLLARDGDAAFPILERFVPHGVVRFWVVERALARVAIVVMIDSSTGGVQVAEYEFDSTNDKYVLGAVLLADGRVLHRTPFRAFE